MVTKTAFVEFETNRYSVPTAYAEQAAEVWAQPESLEIVVHGKTVAVHRRLFERREKAETPAHRAVLLERTPRFKLQRIHQLIANWGRRAPPSSRTWKLKAKTRLRRRIGCSNC